MFRNMTRFFKVLKQIIRFFTVLDLPDCLPRLNGVPTGSRMRNELEKMFGVYFFILYILSFVTHCVWAVNKQTDPKG